MKILIRTDGGLELGNGHIVRMLSLAEQLEERKIDFGFAIRGDNYWFNQLKGKKYNVVRIQDKIEQTQELIEIVKNQRISHLVYDTRNELTKEELNIIKKKTGVFLSVIDSPEDTRLVGDAVIYPPIPQIKEWKWDGFKGNIYSGWEYVFIRKEFHPSNNKEAKKNSNNILLSFGSTDPFLITEMMLRVIFENYSLFRDCHFILLVGPQFNRIDEIKQMKEFQFLNIELIQSPSKLADLFNRMYLAFIAFGVTAYELASCSIPFLAVSPTKDHEKSVKVFEEAGLGFSLGTIDQFASRFVNAVKEFQSQEDVLLNHRMHFLNQNKIGDYSLIIKAITNYA